MNIGICVGPDGGREDGNHALSLLNLELALKLIKRILTNYGTV